MKGIITDDAMEDAMREMWVRGIFFNQVLDYVRKKRGQTSYELLGLRIEDYKIEEKYGFEEFSELLAKIKILVAGEDDFIARISRETMTEEARWKTLFRRMDPANVFASTKRQEGRHQVADFEALEVNNGSVTLRMTMWTENRDHQDLWADFYRGRLEGILELIGRSGTVKVLRDFGKKSTFTYHIEWN